MRASIDSPEKHSESSNNIHPSHICVHSSLLRPIRNSAIALYITRDNISLFHSRTKATRCFLQFCIILLLNVFRDAEGSRITFPVSGGEGSATAQMYLYQDANYDNPYNGIPVLQSSDMLYAEIALEDPINALSLVSRECWATPESTGSSSERFKIIEEPGCLNTAAKNAKLTSNGVTSYSRFEFQVFTFMPSNVAYLHCEIELCYNSEGRTCQPTCGVSGRRKRSTNYKRIRSSAIIRAKEHVNSPSVTHPIATTPDTHQPADTFTTDVVVYVLAGVTVAMVLIIASLIIYVCVLSRKKTNKPCNEETVSISH